MEKHHYQFEYQATGSPLVRSGHLYCMPKEFSRGLDNVFMTRPENLTKLIIDGIRVDHKEYITNNVITENVKKIIGPISDHPIGIDLSELAFAKFHGWEVNALDNSIEFRSLLREKPLVANTIGDFVTIMQFIKLFEEIL